MPRILIHFARYGPYHHARLRSAVEALTPLGWDVIGLEIAGTDATYAWDQSMVHTRGLHVVTAFPGRVHEEITAPEYRKVLHPLLASLKPDAMAIAGWASTDAIMSLAWCRKHDVRRIVMSETRAADGKRVWWKELAKRYLISRFDGALVGGASHRDYLVKLGMPKDRIEFGYDVVDNDYFAGMAQDAREKKRARETGGTRQESGTGGRNAASSSQSPACSPEYFLASNRFIGRKNLGRLIQAYGAYARRRQGSDVGNRELDGCTRQSSIWPLVLLGDGEQKPALITLCHELGLRVEETTPWETSPPPMPPGLVLFPGFRQIDELPRFYAHAGCFIHPALEEPWGLVINEAMACGLPILSGNNVGAAEELVVDGVNGWKFDATQVDAMTDLMLRVSAPGFPLSTFRSASCRILRERAPTQAFGKGLANILSR